MGRELEPGPTKSARLEVANTAREIRARLRASRQPVSPSVDDYASRRRGARLADGLCFLAITMIDGAFTPEEAKQVGAALVSAVVDDVAARRSAA